MAYNQTTTLLLEEYLMFFMNMMYQSILSWMAVGLASLIGIFEMGKFKKISTKSILFWVLFLFFILSGFKIFDHWSFLSDCRRELHTYSSVYNVTIRNYKNTGKNVSVPLMFQSPGNWVTIIFNEIFNLPYKIHWLLYVIPFLILFIWAGLWFENCTDYSYKEFKADISHLWRFIQREDKRGDKKHG